jgi:chromosome partitioning protein
MPVIVFASSKGGAGKSTSAVILATQLAFKGATVKLIDADPNQPVFKWFERGQCPQNLSVDAKNISEDTILDKIESAAEHATFVVVDLEGTASMTVAYAISAADLVIIPTQGSQLDAAEASKTIKLVQRQERVAKRAIPYAILFTKTSGAIRPRTLRHIRQDFTKRGTPMFRTQMQDRDAFRAIFSFGGTLESLPPREVSNRDAAIANARQLAKEAVDILRGNRVSQRQEAEVA